MNDLWAGLIGVLAGLASIAWGVVALILWPNPIQLFPIASGVFCLGAGLRLVLS